jgi:acetyltransferase-like isoleucine patch superfamily enzyme
LMAIDCFAGVAHSPRLSIGDGTYIGRYCTLSCVKELSVGRDVTFGDNVYVADSSHGFSEVGKHVMAQPLVEGAVRIGDRAWLGKNSVVTGTVTIGENAIVAANSFVARDVPAYTMVAGSPAVPVKRFDASKSEWVKF